MNRVVGFLERRKFMKLKRIISMLMSITILSTMFAFTANNSPTVLDLISV